MDNRELPASSDSEDIDELPTTSTSLSQSAYPGTARTGRKKSSAPRIVSATQPSEVAEDHALQKHSFHERRHPQKPLLVVGCLVAAAVATACLRHWLKRRKLRPKAQNVEALLTRCKLQPSMPAQTAGSAPLHNTTFVVSQVYVFDRCICLETGSSRFSMHLQFVGFT